MWHMTKLNRRLVFAAASCFISFGLTSFGPSAEACSRSLWSVEGQPVLVGRNMDWTAKMGTKLWVMPRGIEHTGMTQDNPLTWTSKYGSVVASVWDIATADGMNEAGLNVNNLYLAETKFADRDPSIPGLSVSLWMQYYLDNFATVAEAIEASNSFQVVPLIIMHQGIESTSPVHLSLADPSGDSAIIEIIDGKVTIHHGKEYTVMTNSPPYDEQLVLLKQFQGLGGNKPLPGTFEAADRFVRGAYYLTQLPKKPATYQQAVAGVMTVMRNQATPIGANDPVRPNVSATLWQTVSDLTNKRYYFGFTDMPNVVWIDMDKLNLDKGAPIQMFDLASDVEAAGEVSGKFTPSEQIAYQMAGTTVPEYKHKPAQ